MLLQDAVNAWELSWPKRVLPTVKKRRLEAGLHEDPGAAWAKQAGPERGLLTAEQVRTPVYSTEYIMKAKSYGYNIQPYGTGGVYMIMLSFTFLIFWFSGFLYFVLGQQTRMQTVQPDCRALLVRLFIQLMVFFVFFCWLFVFYLAMNIDHGGKIKKSLLLSPREMRPVFIFFVPVF